MRRARGVATVRSLEGASMETVALGALGEKLVAEARSASSGRYAVTIHGGHVNSLRQTVIALVAGHRLDEHENTGEITLQLLRGRARVVAASDDAELVTGDYAVIPLEWDSFEALEDTVVLLTASVEGLPD
jgi:quercetin dioxygenase-like cupin family protein